MSSAESRTVPIDAGQGSLDAWTHPGSLDALFGSHPDGVVVQSPEGVVYANDAALRAMGSATLAALRQAAPDLPGRRALAEGAPCEALLPLPAPAGEERWALVKASPVRDAAGRIALALNVLQEGAEEARRVGDARLAQFYERSPVALFSTTPEGAFLEANLAFARLVGQPDLRSLLGLSAAAVYADPAKRGEIRAALEREGTVRGFETDFLRADGVRVPVSITARAIRDAAGKVLRYEGVVEDVSARKAAQEELVVQKALLEAQMESVLDAILVVGLDGRILSWNKVFADLWGIPVDLLASRDVDACRQVALARVKDPDAFLEGTRYYGEKAEETCRDEVELADGRVLDRFGAPVRMPDGTLVGRIWSYRDVTQPRQQAAALRATMDAVQDGILILGEEGRVAARNAQLASVWGLSEEDLDAMPAEVVLPGLAARVEDAAAFVAAVEAMRAAPAPVRDEVRLRSGRVLERYGAPVRGPDGRLHGRVWTFRDITEAKASEERLRRLLAEISSQRARLDAIVRSVPGVVWEAWSEPDPAAQRIDFVSDHVERMLGYAPQEWLAVPEFWLGIVHPDDREAAAREARLRLEGKSAAPQEFRWIAKDGRVLWAQTHSTPILDGAGRPVGMRGVTLDVSDRKRAEEDIRESEARWRFLANALPGQVWTALPEGRLDYVNQQAARYFGRPEEQVVADGWTALVHPDDLPGTLARWTRSLETGEPFEVEFRLKRSDGAWRWHLGRATPRRDAAGAIEKWYGANADVQDLKDGERALKDRAAQLARLAAQLERSNRELDQFAYVTSHDLKAPLRGIANLSRWIEEDLGGEVPPEVRAHMDLLRGRVARMESLIDAILEYSRVGRVKAEPEPVDSGKLVAEIVDLLSPPQGFRVEVAQDMPTLVAERLRLHQVFLNLIGNAIKHHHRKDAGTVRVSAQDGGGHWLFRVEDDGPGIAPRYHDKVFVIFQTLQARDKVEGTGIGLALVKKIVEGAGGAIRLESEEGRGAAFTFSWPKAAGEGRS